MMVSCTVSKTPFAEYVAVAALKGAFDAEFGPLLAFVSLVVTLNSTSPVLKIGTVTFCVPPLAVS